MDVREATPDDVDALESLVEGPLDATQLIHDRTVILAETADGIQGFVSYDIFDDAVHVSTIVGDADALEALLAEPRRFAAAEELPIEIVVPESAAALNRVVQTVGFEPVGAGPRFDGEPTRRFRYAR